MLQTEPQIQEVLGLEEAGHDYFLQITDARPDTGGLSGATATEAMTWGKVDPEKLPDSVTCYTDSTIALPLLTAYALARHEPRPLKTALRPSRVQLRRASRRLPRPAGRGVEGVRRDSRGWAPGLADRGRRDTLEGRGGDLP